MVALGAPCVACGSPLHWSPNDHAWICANCQRRAPASDEPSASATMPETPSPYLPIPLGAPRQRGASLNPDRSPWARPGEASSSEGDDAGATLLGMSAKPAPPIVATPTSSVAASALPRRRPTTQSPIITAGTPATSSIATDATVPRPKVEIDPEGATGVGPPPKTPVPTPSPISKLKESAGTDLESTVTTGQDPFRDEPRGEGFDSTLTGGGRDALREPAKKAPTIPPTVEDKYNPASSSSSNLPRYAPFPLSASFVKEAPESVEPSASMAMDMEKYSPLVTAERARYAPPTNPPAPAPVASSSSSKLLVSPQVDPLATLGGGPATREQGSPYSPIPTPGSMPSPYAPPGIGTSQQQLVYTPPPPAEPEISPYAPGAKRAVQTSSYSPFAHGGPLPAYQVRQRPGTPFNTMLWLKVLGGSIAGIIVIVLVVNLLGGGGGGMSEKTLVTRAVRALLDEDVDKLEALALPFGMRNKECEDDEDELATLRRNQLKKATKKIGRYMRRKDLEKIDYKLIDFEGDDDPTKYKKGERSIVANGDCYIATDVEVHRIRVNLTVEDDDEVIKLVALKVDGGWYLADFLSTGKLLGDGE